MDMKINDTERAFTLTAENPHREVIYRPAESPGFVAWATAFDYGNGKIGLSFKETLRQKNERYIPPKLEMGEAVGAPVSYCSVECGSPDMMSYRVYMISGDNGKTFHETGRCPLEEGSFCNVGFPDGRIIGFDVPRINEDATGWCNFIEVRESLDGGTTWHRITRLLEGCAPYLWRVRRLRNGKIILCASLYGTAWGKGYERTTRNTMLPGETYLNKIQTFFMTSEDGRSFSEPHYILPGTGAHEFDFVELEDGSLLFIAGDVQGTPVARQTVTPSKDGWINGTLYGIRRGAPPDPSANPQGGFVPETMIMTKDGLIVGARRNKPYSCSNDLGENWFEVENLPPSLYQPFMIAMPDGTIANFGHKGGDSAFGKDEMYIGADFFMIKNTLPKSGTLRLYRNLSEDNSHYINRFTAEFTSNNKPVAGETLTFRFTPVWAPDGTISSVKQDETPYTVQAVTDENGKASVSAHWFDGIGDIHFYYNVDVVYRPGETGKLLSCDGPLMCVAALTPYRRCLYPYDAYFAEGTLFLSPDFVRDYPQLPELLKALCGRPDDILPEGYLPDGAVERLLASGVLRNENGVKCWLHSVHAPQPLYEVAIMSSGDWYE